MSGGRKHRLLVRLIPAIVAWVIRIWFKTCRVTVINGEALPTIEDSKKTPSIAVFYHYSILYVFYHLRMYRAAVMVSASNDGDYIARLAELLGFKPVRGSRHNRGVGGLREMLREISRGNNCGIVADGSRGPARVVQPGAVILASRTGAPVLPMVWSASRYFSFRSWDKTVLPKPFATIYYVYGDPLVVPPGIDAARIEEHRILLQERLNDLYQTAWRLVDRNEH